jgi:hypothetical protein
MINKKLLLLPILALFATTARPEETLSTSTAAIETVEGSARWFDLLVVQ